MFELTSLPWHAKAACLDYPTSFFFPERGGNFAEIREVCATCSVQGECLDFALTWNEVHGFWGGKSERERRTMKKDIRLKPREYRAPRRWLR